MHKHRANLISKSSNKIFSFFLAFELILQRGKSWKHRKRKKLVAFLDIIASFIKDESINGSLHCSDINELCTFKYFNQNFSAFMSPSSSGFSMSQTNNHLFAFFDIKSTILIATNPIMSFYVKKDKMRQHNSVERNVNYYDILR